MAAHPGKPRILGRLQKPGKRQAMVSLGGPRRSSPAHTLILDSQICESGSFYCLWSWVTAAPQNKHQEPILTSSTWWQYGCHCSGHHFQASEEGKQG